EENTVEWTNSFGMQTSGSNNVFRGNHVNDNGQLGIGGSCSGCLLEYNQTNRNNWKRFNVSWEGGAMKFVYTTNTTLRYHQAGDNFGNGIWFDGHNSDNVIEQSIAYRNLQSNIFLEAHTTKTIVRNNVSFGATVYVTPTYTVGGAGMIIYRSPNNTIVNNTFFGNERIGLWIENNRK